MEHTVRYGHIPMINVDPRYAISALCMHTKNENQDLVREVKQLADRADRKPKLHWTPSHVGITENKEAKQRSKAGTPETRSRSGKP